MTAPLAGEIVRTSHYPKVRAIKKAANESVTSSTTLQNDDDFSFDVLADRTYLVHLSAIVTGATAGDVKFAWALTGGAALLGGRHVQGPQLATTDVTATSMRSSGAHAETTSVSYGVDGSAGSTIVEEFLVETTTLGTDGTVTLQWAQQASSGTGTTMNANSWLTITEVDLI